MPERSTYPLTGRFLEGRLRHAMTEREKGIVEGLIERTEHFPGPRRILARADCVNYSTILIEGFVARVIIRDGKRFIIGMRKNNE